MNNMENDKTRELLKDKSLFEINELEFNILDTKAGKVFMMDNFYKNPDAIVKFIDSHDPPLWKVPPARRQRTFNGKCFEDKRLVLDIPECEKNYLKVCDHLEKQGIRCSPTDSLFLTNQTKFWDSEFNDYGKFYWWPHQDHGHMNALVYLNKSSESGTNLYSHVDGSNYVKPERDEHEQPWDAKESWNILHKVESKFNRLVIFDGDVYHGMDINSDEHFVERRLNQVFFLGKCTKA